MSKNIVAVLACIAALAPEGEEFKPEAVVNEGIWMTEAHLTAVENKLSADAAALVQAGEDLAAANTAKTTAENDLAAANQTIEANNTRIQELEAENAKLKGTPAAEITQTTTNEDTPPAPVATVVTDPKAKYRTSFDAQAEAYAKK